ncbi:MAG TPA: hypothetical protein VHL79_21410 [Ramlibacter sp.]|nr:hypothetical protein [Ramlibacter sp.]
MLRPHFLCELKVRPEDHPRGQRHLSAASGLVFAHDRLYLIADDEHHLATLDFPPRAGEPVRLYRLRAGDLPHDAAARKRLKPDLEVLLALPAPGAPLRLLALGSGSRPNRQRGFLLDLDAAGQPQGGRELDLGPLYGQLASQLQDLNIEGGLVCGEDLLLLARANQGQAQNTVVGMPMIEVLRWLESGTVPSTLQVEPLDAGRVGDVPYGITDAVALPGAGWIFSAVAEATDDSYADGACTGSAIGWVTAQGRVQAMHPLHGAPKVEGMALAPGGRLLLVTDADDPKRPSQLLELRLEDVLS